MKDRNFLIGFLVTLLVITVIAVVGYLTLYSTDSIFTNDMFGTLVFLLVFILVVFISVLKRLITDANSYPRGKNEAL